MLIFCFLFVLYLSWSTLRFSLASYSPRVPCLSLRIHLSWPTKERQHSEWLFWWPHNHRHKNIQLIILPLLVGPIYERLNTHCHCNYNIRKFKVALEKLSQFISKLIGYNVFVQAVSHSFMYTFTVHRSCFPLMLLLQKSIFPRYS